MEQTRRRPRIRFLIVLLLVTTLRTSSGYQSASLLQGKHLTVTVENFPRFSTIERNSSGHVIGYSGSLVAHFDWLSQKLAFEYTMIPWDNSITKPIASNVTRNPFVSMIDQLIKEEVDASLGPFVVRLERQDIGIGGLTAYIGSILLVRYPSYMEKSICATFEPYSYQIWIGIVISLLAVVACAWFIIYISNRFMKLEIPLQKTTAKIWIYFFKVTIQQGNSYSRITHSMGVLAFIWSLVAIVVVNVYNSSIISYLSANYKKPEVSTFKELAENNNYNMLSIKGTIAEFDLVASVTKDLQIVAKKYARCRECSIQYNPDLIAKKLMEENYVAVIADLLAVGIIEKNTPKWGTDCKLTMGNDKLKFYHTFFGVPKNSPFQTILRQESLWYISHGFSMHLEATVGIERCLLKYNNKGVQSESIISPIKLKQLFIPFVILICGWLLAFFQFIRELLHAHIERQMNHDNSTTVASIIIATMVEPTFAEPDPSSHPLTLQRNAVALTIREV